jgi:hypothetical protein
MAKSTSETDSIEALLQQRAQYEQWLARLDSAGDKAPPAVRAKVRGDYEGRLRGVIDELRGHAATIAAELDRHKATQGGLDLERRQAEEALAEAEVRHAVGEYSETDWRKLSDQSNEQLTRLRSELRLVGEEIARLAEVQGLIGGAPAPAPPPSPPPVTAAPEPEPEPKPEPVAPPPPPAPSPASRPVAKAEPVREPEITHGPPPVDELAFLKSVAPAEERKAAPAPAPGPARRASNPGGPLGGRGSESPVAASQTAAPGKGGAAGVAKTLKCGECGTLNRPTEWYCERCGAELAGI